MKNFYLSLCLVLLTFSFGKSQDSLSRATIRKKARVIYACLDMEKAAGYEVDESNYRLLDTILFLSEKNIKSLDSSHRDYPKNILKEIHSTLESIGIEGDYTQTDPYKNLLSYSLKTKKFDCDKYSFTFLAVARILDLPLYAVLLPSHMAIEWSDSKQHFYWETTDKNEYTKDEYVKRFGLNKYHFKENMYLSRIPDEQLKNCFRYNMGITQLMSDKYREAYENLDSSKCLKGIHPFLYRMQHICKNKITIQETSALIAINPSNDSARIERAKAYINLKGRDNNEFALLDLNVVLRTDPENHEAYLWRGVAHLNNFMLGRLNHTNRNYKRALEDFNYLLDLDYYNYEAHLYKSILKRWVRDYEVSEREIEEALKIRFSEKALMEKGNILYNKNKYEEAITVYNQALQLNPHCVEAIQWRGFAKLELEKRDDAAEDFFKAYYHGLMPYEYFEKYIMMGATTH